MKITSAEFQAEATSPAAIPRGDLPEIAISGRSNVGKSSLINAMTRRKALARTSNTPGCTRGIIFFRINDRTTLTDLPGYGYAQRSKAERARWSKLIEGYLREREQLAGALILVDVRRGPEDEEIDLAGFLTECGVPYLWVLTKADKIKRAQLQKRLDELAPLFAGAPCVVTSAKTRAGIDGLWKWIEAASNADSDA